MQYFTDVTIAITFVTDLSSFIKFLKKRLRNKSCGFFSVLVFTLVETVIGGPQIRETNFLIFQKYDVFFFPSKAKTFLRSKERNYRTVMSKEPDSCCIASNKVSYYKIHKYFYKIYNRHEKCPYNVLAHFNLQTYC